MPDFKRLGVQTLTPSIHRSSVLALMARNPAMFELMTSTTDDRDLREMVLENPELHGKHVNEINFPSNLRILAIRRDEEVIVPHGATRLAVGDHITVLGDLDMLEKAKEWAGGW